MHDELVILLEERAPLDRGDWPVEYIFVDEVVKTMIILSPLNDAVGLAHLHIAPTIKNMIKDYCWPRGKLWEEQ